MSLQHSHALDSYAEMRRLGMHHSLRSHLTGLLHISDAFKPLALVKAIRAFAEEHFPDVSRDNPRFFPTAKAIAKEASRIRLLASKSTTDEDALSNWVKDFQQSHSDNRAKLTWGDDDSSCFMIVVQSAHMRRMLMLHGSVCFAMDSTFGTNRYGLPLFFVSVRDSNGHYQCVAFFFIFSERGELIQPALRQLKAWNPAWRPLFSMTDKSEAEMNAITEIFPNITVLICMFHTKKAWLAAIHARCPELSSDDRLSFYRVIAQLCHCTSTSRFEEALTLVRQQVGWNKLFSKYFNNEWLTCTNLWARHTVAVFHGGFETTNGVESLNAWVKGCGFTGSSRTLGTVLQGLVNALRQQQDNYRHAQTRTEPLFMQHSDIYKGRLNLNLTQTYRSLLKETRRSLEAKRHLYRVDETDATSIFKVSTGTSTHIVDLSQECQMNMHCTCRHYIDHGFMCTHILYVLSMKFNDDCETLPSSAYKPPWVCIDLGDEAASESNTRLPPDVCPEVARAVSRPHQVQDVVPKPDKVSKLKALCGLMSTNAHDLSDERLTEAISRMSALTADVEAWAKEKHDALPRQPPSVVKSKQVAPMPHKEPVNFKPIIPFTLKTQRRKTSKRLPTSSTFNMRLPEQSNIVHQVSSVFARSGKRVKKLPMSLQTNFELESPQPRRKVRDIK